ncbi:hypothetical protein [Lysobacter gummosus]|uniref:hypothetical protein n=1 Tax=Lysobacter gummosus TaxID=262324 RepID=UPI00363D1E61
MAAMNRVRPGCARNNADRGGQRSSNKRRRKADPVCGRLNGRGPGKLESGFEDHRERAYKLRVFRHSVNPAANARTRVGSPA